MFVRMFIFLGFHFSQNHRATIARPSTVANMPQPIRRDRNLKMVAMSYFCRKYVSQIRLEIVFNCSNPSEIQALDAASNGVTPGSAMFVKI